MRFDPAFQPKALTLALLLAFTPCAQAADEVLDEISVTATREARPTADVPQAIAVVGKEALADKKMFNMKEALQEIPGVLVDSKNGGFDARLIIRGAGLKAAYGIREVMVLRDGWLLTDHDVLESELSYSEANIQLPGAMDEALFKEFKRTGKQTDTSEPWKNSGRYSQVWFFNSRLEMERGDFTFKPRVYYNTWHHYHPVTGLINDPQSWVTNIGTDLEADWRHTGGTLVGGVTLRKEDVPNANKYLYRDVRTSSTGRILSTLSDARGELASTSDTSSVLSALYLQESWRPSERWIVDLGMRYDVIEMEDTTNELIRYDYATGTYVTGDGYQHTKKTFHLPAPKLALTYKLGHGINLFGMIAQAGQIPSSSEISSNPSLDAPTSRNVEVGVKGRGAGWQFDFSVYQNKVSDEIVQINTGGVTEYANAGKTDKKGAEFSGSLGLGHGFTVGGNYAYSDYRYASFSEPVRVGRTVVNEDRAGNALPFIPRHQYGLFVGWASPDGWHARLAGLNWGQYWLDNANTEKYRGWDWVLNLAAGYTHGPHSLTLNVDNLTDKRYAFEVKKDTGGKVTYTAASPRAVMLSYHYAFN